MIGTDEYGNSVSLIYNCNNGYCSEIHSLTCERRCNEKVFNTTGKNTFIFDGERVIIARLDCHVNNSCCKILLKSTLFANMFKGINHSIYAIT